MPMSPNDQIEHDIGEMLAAQQLGNLELMHKYYSDSATFVSSDYGPPIVGWKNWAEGYERQKAAFQQMQIIRRNTFIYLRMRMWRGRLTSGIFRRCWRREKVTTRAGRRRWCSTKVGNDWLIVHNHTAVDCSSLAPWRQRLAYAGRRTAAAASRGSDSDTCRSAAELNGRDERS